MRPALRALLLLALTVPLAGCPARRPQTPAPEPQDEIGPPAVLDPTLLDRG